MERQHWSLLIMMMVILVTPAIAQSSSAGGQWSGSIQCELDVQQPNYMRHETQTWTLTGGPPTAAGGTGVLIYPATWNYTGQGALQRADGPRITKAQWQINIVPGEAPVSFTVRDGVLTIKRASAQQKRYSGLVGQQQMAVNGMPQQPTAMPSPALWEWALPWIEATPSSNLSGTMAVQSEGLSGLNPPSQAGPLPSATCKYQLTKSGGPNLTPVSQNCPQANSIAQMFENMKANATREFAVLIQQTQDPSRRAALNAQKQRLLDDLENLKQQNIGANAQPCQGGSGTNPGQNPPTGVSLVKVTPDSVEQGAIGTIFTLIGQSTHWQQGTPTVTVEPGIGVPITNAQVQSPTNLLAQLDIQYSATPGPRKVTVANGTEVVTLPNAFTITPREKPVLLSISPDSGKQGQQNIQVQLTGKNTRWAQDKTRVTIGKPFDASQPGAQPSPDQLTVQVTVHSPTSLTATVSIDPARGTGPYWVSVWDPSPSDWLKNTSGFTVTPTTISASTNIQFTSPNGGETWLAGTLNNVNWKHTYGANQLFDIDFSSDGGHTWSPLSHGLQPRVLNATTGEVTAFLRMPAASTTTGRVRVSQAGNSASGTVSNSVTLVTPSVAVTSPAQGANLQTGSDTDITWTVNGGGVYPAKVEVSRNGGTTWEDNGTIVPNGLEHKRTWHVSGPASTQAKLRVTLFDSTSNVMVGQPAVSGNFTIGDATSPANQHSINIWSLTPNTNLAVGCVCSIGITQSYGESQLFDIDFSSSAGSTWTPLARSLHESTNGSANNYGFIDVTMPSTPTNNASIRISPAGNPGAGTTAAFHLVKPSVNITSPATGATFTVGSDANIAWSYNGPAGATYVFWMEVSHDGGATWRDQTSFGPKEWDVSSTTSSTWHVAGPATQHAKLRVSFISGPQTSPMLLGESSEFTIVDAGPLATATVVPFIPTMTLASPIKQVTPNSASQGTTNLAVALNGSFANFVQGTTTANFGPGITVTSFKVDSQSSATAKLNIDPQAAGGARTITLNNGTQTAALTDGFTVMISLTATPIITTMTTLKKPAIGRVSPNSTTLGTTITKLTITINVENMTLVQDHTHVDFGIGFAWEYVTVNSAHSATVGLSLDPSTDPGTRTVQIFNDSGEVARLENGFTVVRGTGRYRISLNGFRVNHEVNAGAFGREHNAIFAAAAVELLNRQNNLAVLQPWAITRSLVHGDISKGVGRVQAGHASPSGGLVAGDVVPAGQNPASITSTPSSTTFPFMLWQGPLTDKLDAVVVRPALWVNNGGTETYDAWLAGHSAWGGNELHDIQTKINNSDMSPLLAGWMDIFCVDLPSVYESAHHVNCGPGDDRPIGLRECYSLGGCWLNVDVVITREAIEKALSSSYQTGGFAPGVIEIHFADGGAGAGTAHFEGNYDLYLRVESVP